MALITDSEGNQIGFRFDGLYLRLAGQKRLKLLFKIKNGAVSKWISPSNILRKANAIGFNYDGLKELKNKGHNFITIIIGSQNSFSLKIDDILEKGDFLWFKNQGFEKQIFWKLN